MGYTPEYHCWSRTGLGLRWFFAGRQAVRFASLASFRQTAETRRLRRLLRIQLDDQRFVDVAGQVAAIRQGLEHARRVLRVELDPARPQIHALGNLHGFLHAQLLLRIFGELDLVTGAHHVRRHVDLLAVDHHRFVRDELARLRAGHRKAHAIHDVVEARFQQAQQVFTGVALQLGSLLVVVAELALEHAIDALDLLLLAQLHGIVGRTRTLGRDAMLAGLVVELAFGVDRARRALQRQVGAFATGQLAGGTNVTCHVFRPSASWADGSRCAESA